ncbi:hypothetical protein WOLCODRAFT_153341 [Wolfiporia cocos MD-104 SS10]|uniref:Retrotransposon gag domain-containing protein n=1 Tax=Wolfiporia cocos (strain MD-104) TaxID=742152 RepID=A0A2H3JM64_WOLCO|nr:hypothetical protein WOLCODRAFT_153341 [Wolfiporia cocos MD-104 SS10]
MQAYIAGLTNSVNTLPNPPPPNPPPPPSEPSHHSGDTVVFPTRVARGVDMGPVYPPKPESADWSQFTPMPTAWEDFDPKWKSKVKEPDAFDNDKIKLKDWWIDMEQYISSNKQLLMTSSQKVETAFSYIRGSKVKSWKESFYRKYYNRTQLWWSISWERFQWELFNKFDDPDRKKKAFRAMQALSMRLGQSTNYFTDLETLCEEAEFDMDNSYILELIEKNVPRDVFLPTYMSFAQAKDENGQPRPIPTDYPTWKNSIEHADHYLFRINESMKSHQNTSKPTQRRPTTNNTSNTNTVTPQQRMARMEMPCRNCGNKKKDWADRSKCTSPTWHTPDWKQSKGLPTYTSKEVPTSNQRARATTEIPTASTSSITEIPPTSQEQMREMKIIKPSTQPTLRHQDLNGKTEASKKKYQGINAEIIAVIPDALVSQ